MVQDLVILAIIGFILEVLCTKMTGFVLDAIPTCTISFLILFISIARWNLWGLLITPVLALATMLGGMWHVVSGISAVYDWKVFLSVWIALLPLGVNVIFFKKIGTKKIVQKIPFLIALLLMNYVLFNFTQLFMFRILDHGNPIVIGNPVYSYTYKNDEGEEFIKNYYMDYNFIYNLFGFFISIIGSIILRSQGVLNNVIDKLVEDKENAEMLKVDEESFKIEEVSEADATAEEESKPA